MPIEKLISNTAERIFVLSFQLCANASKPRTTAPLIANKGIGQYPLNRSAQRNVFQAAHVEA